MDNNFKNNTGLNNNETNFNNPYSYNNQNGYSAQNQPSIQPQSQMQQQYTSPNYTPNDFSTPTPKKKKSGGKAGLAVAAICAAIIISGGAFYAGVTYNANSSGTSASANAGTSNKNNKVETAAPLNVSSDTTDVNNPVTSVVENAMPSMVAISTVNEEQVDEFYGYFYRFMDPDFNGTFESQASGSGIIIDETDDELLIVTNNHVIEGANNISVEFVDGKSYSATIKGTAAANDLAVISVNISDIDDDSLKAIKVAVLGDSTKLKLGESAIAIGNSLGYGQSVTVGYISAMERTVQLSDKTLTLLQTDAAINPGNSGGALLNIKGEVIGINSAKYSDTSVEGTGYAIPISDALPIIEKLMNAESITEGDQAYLGIMGDSVQPSYIERFGWPEGVYVTEVTADSPAERSGLLPGDIITAIDGTSIKAMDDIQSILMQHSAGDKITLSVTRATRGKTEESELTATLIARKDANINQ